MLFGMLQRILLHVDCKQRRVHPRGESGGVHESDKLEQKIWLRFKQIWRLLSDSSLKFSCVVSRNAIPSLRLAPNALYSC